MVVLHSYMNLSSTAILITSLTSMCIHKRWLRCHCSQQRATSGKLRVLKESDSLQEAINEAKLLTLVNNQNKVFNFT
jgi:hypothetical protein